MSEAASLENPIFNSPYEPPAEHFVLGAQGSTGQVSVGRRPSESFVPVPVGRRRRAGIAEAEPNSEQHALDFDVTGERRQVNSLISDSRAGVDSWRAFGYPGVTPVTRKLLQHWADPAREDRVLFCQREAAETAIYLAEAAGRRGEPDFRSRVDAENRAHKPYVDNRKMRVTGPFTVESLSPHRSLAFVPTSEPATERVAAVDPDVPTFEQTVLENLRAAGIQNGRRAERLTFDDVESYAGTYVQAVGTRAEAEAGTPSRVGISLGPQYGTVSPKFVVGATREASKAADLDLLCLLGFAFDPQVLGASEEFFATDESFDVAAERALGRIPVLLVRMNADLLMGEDLKKTGAGNLFTVFHEPDIEARETGDGELVVQVNGVDVYDPTTGEVRSGGVDQVALWMIETDYDEESFFVRHCYFTGGQDPYKRLKSVLKADIDEDAWATLNRTESRPFPRPSTSKVAVKVINDYGDEVVKVIEV